MPAASDNSETVDAERKATKPELSSGKTTTR
jgi:hypothetical protein